MWDRESSLTLQRGQEDSKGEMGKMDFNLAFVGKISQAIFQRKRINLAFILSFQRDFQVLVAIEEMALETLLLLISLWAKFVEKLPSEEGVQRKLELGEGLM